MWSLLTQICCVSPSIWVWPLYLPLINDYIWFPSDTHLSIIIELYQLNLVDEDVHLFIRRDFYLLPFNSYQMEFFENLFWGNDGNNIWATIMILISILKVLLKEYCSKVNILKRQMSKNNPLYCLGENTRWGDIIVN